MTSGSHAADRAAGVTGFFDEQPARDLIERLPVPMLAFGVDGLVLYVNPALERMLGYEAGSMVGQWLPRFLSMAAEADSAAAATAVRTAGGDVMTWLHRDGVRVRAAVSHPLPIPDHIQAILVALTDVTEWLWALGRDGTSGRLPG